MQNFIEFLNQKTKNKFEYLKLSAVTYYKTSNSLLFVLLYPDKLKTVEEEDRKIIFDFAKEFVNLEVNLELKFVKSFYDLDYLKIRINEFNKEEYPALSTLIQVENLKVVEENAEQITLDLTCFKNYISAEQKQKYITRLEQFLNNEFFYLFVVTLSEIEREQKESVIEKVKQEVFEKIMTDVPVKKTLKIEVLEQILGDDCSLTPLCVSAVTAPENKISVAGMVKNLQEREFTKKQKVMDAEEERFAEVKKTYFSFNLVSNNKEINAVYFPNKDTIEQLRKLADGQEVVVTGDVEAFNGKLSLKVKHITKVNILDKPVVKENFAPVPSSYKYVFPEEFEVVTQASLFEQFSEPSPYLKNNTFVVFDLETTGLNHEDCQIVEIGAVKIENGKITKKFSTFVDPEVEIPLDATAIHGITDAMVMGAPKMHEALADFYKFCENSTIIAYNIDFDYKFINYYGRKSGFLFNHPQKDALVMAKQYIKGLKNYKLKTVAESLGVNLSNAHRAYFDAAATAEVFLKLAENIK